MKKTIVLILSILALVSCTEFFDVSIPLEVDPHESRMAPSALLGNFTSDFYDEAYNNYIFLSRSKGALDNSETPLSISQATITLSTDNIMINYTEKYDHQGYYFPNEEIDFIAGQVYKLSIEKSGFHSITSTQVYPSHVPVISANISNEILKVKFQDAPNVKDHYFLQLITENDNNITYTVYLKPFDNSIIKSHHSGGGLLFTDELFDGTLKEITAKTGSMDPDASKLKVLLFHVTEDYFYYFKSLKLNEETEENPFAEPVIMYTNIENGYGIFGLRNTSEYIIE